MTRRATAERKTAETEVRASVDLDGSGSSTISTGIGFFDHLLTALSHHALIDVEISTVGDLEVDDHHTVEDTALVLGTALAGALAEREGIVRYGDAVVPMDEALARAAVDVGGRPYAVIDVPFRGERIGALSTQMIPHAIEALARTAGFTIHVSATGRNDHHVAEAAFKALGRAMRKAVTPDERRRGIASTKGVPEKRTT